MQWEDRIKQLVEIATIDESTDYEVNQCLLGYDPVAQKYVALMAEGCSCWDGEYREESFDSLVEMVATLPHSPYHECPSLMGLLDLYGQIIARLDGITEGGRMEHDKCMVCQQQTTPDPDWCKDQR